MNWNKLKFWTDDDAPRKSQVDPDDIADLETVVQPDTWEDKTHRSLTERLYLWRRTILAGAVLVAAVVALLSIYLRTFLFNYLQNPILRELVKWTAMGTLGYALGRRATLAAHSNQDELIVWMDGSAVRYVGEYRSLERADADERAFVAYTGRSSFFHRPRVLEVRDLDEDLSRLKGTDRLDPEDPVAIGLDNAVVDVNDTDDGTLVHVMASGIEVYPWSDAPLYAQPPDLADKDQFRRLERQYRTVLEEDIPDLEVQLDAKEQRLARLREELSTERGETIEQFLERVEQAVEASTPDRRRGQGAGTTDEDAAERARQRAQQYKNGDGS